ncbi:SnoaL-like domain protein [Candidatus Nitrosocosmicus oleophilus]|jgi:ketosteroid isomerase-like protein|uniref:SnoaL-like domain protein n=1 Tax=Candidatus Nitrosocosmicus oleophilus TaxID=1353260 RepID=A0A654LXK8_9ARCH|nr:nuclear transport factor 2 family protein [Candidatus Nitrosocosmicus oleophilus]ALI36208.1 SnoaL-like domain protein [Candidatus Nitrosocosmicus oleophilus]
MANNTPEELLNRVTECINSKDVDSFISLYEPEASFIDESGESINGREKIGEKIKGYMDMDGKSESFIIKVIHAGDIVLAFRDWNYKASGPDGTPINLGGTAIDVLRKQTDNTWLRVIDSPWGIKK